MLTFSTVKWCQIGYIPIMKYQIHAVKSIVFFYAWIKKLILWYANLVKL